MLATQTEVSDGTLNIVNVGIEFFNQADISVSLGLSDPLVLGVDYQWNTGTSIQFLNTAHTPGGLVPNGVEVLLRRDTQNEDMYNIFDGGAPFSRLALDENYKQLLFLSQEFSEGLGLDGLRNNLDMGGYRITSLGDPINSTDAVNKSYVDFLNGRALRAPDLLNQLPNAAGRANKILAFGADGQPVVSIPAADSAAALELRLLDTVDPLNGAGMIGRNSQVVPSIAALKLLDKTAVSQHAFVVSYYGDGLLGGGHYYLDAADTTTVDNGGSVIVAADGGRWKLNSSTYSFGQFGAKADFNGTTGTDNTAAIQACINATLGQQGMQTVVGAVTGGYVSLAKPIVGEAGAFRITAALTCPSYMRLRGQGCMLWQTSVGVDILVGTTAYQWEVDSVHFVGGRHQISMENANLDVTRWSITRCTFSLNSGICIRTFPTGGATSHLSCICLVKECAFYKPKQVALNYCDCMYVQDSWVFVSKDNFSASSAVFVNGSLTTDGYPNLYLDNMFGIPAMGTQGVDRLALVRWCDLFKGAIHATKSRFGGEFAGMPPVYVHAVPPTTYPYRGAAVYLDDCELFAGPAAAIDSGVISLQGQIPNRISIRNSAGPVEAPYVTNAGSQIPSIPTYFANYTAASGQPAYTQFMVEVLNNSSLAPGVSRVPTDLRPYVNNYRGTKIRRTTTQVLANGFVSNLVSFSSADFDTQGGWAVANPTRIVMPAGATKLHIQASFSFDGGWTGNNLQAAIVTSGLAIEGGQCLPLSANSSNTAYTLSVDVDGAPGTYWHLEIKHNASGSQNMINARVTTTALDYIN